MLIEQDARRYITDAINVEKEITSSEVRERAKGVGGAIEVLFIIKR